MRRSKKVFAVVGNHQGSTDKWPLWVLEAETDCQYLQPKSTTFLEVPEKNCFFGF